MLYLQNLHISRSSITIPLMIVFCLLLVFVLAGSKLSVKKAHACTEYIVPGSTTIFAFVTYQIIFSLWYDTCTSSNFASANITSGREGGLTVQVCRNSGNGLPFACATQSGSCPDSGVCDSQEVYSPINTAYAEIYDGDADVQSASF